MSEVVVRPVDRNPLAIKSAIIEVITAAITLIALIFDAITPELALSLIGISAAVVSAVVLVVRPDVTPVKDPKDANGNPLIEVDPYEYEDFLVEEGDEYGAEAEVASEGEEA